MTKKLGRKLSPESEAARKEVVEKKDDLTFMRHPEWWPYFGALPMKRWANRGEGTPMEMRVGVLISWDTDLYYWFPDKTMFEHLYEKEGESKTNEQLAEIVEAGWIVD